MVNPPGEEAQDVVLRIAFLVRATSQVLAIARGFAIIRLKIKNGVKSVR
jgi:hypothetical protein